MASGSRSITRVHWRGELKPQAAARGFVLRTTLVTVPVKDKPGALAKVTAALGEAKVNIRGLAADKAGVRFLTDDPAKTVRALEAHHFRPRAVMVYDIGLDDEPGTLAELSEALAHAKVNIESVWGISFVDGGHLLVHVDDMEKADPIMRRFHKP